MNAIEPPLVDLDEIRDELRAPDVPLATCPRRRASRSSSARPPALHHPLYMLFAAHGKAPPAGDRRSDHLVGVLRGARSHRRTRLIASAARSTRPSTRFRRPPSRRRQARSPNSLPRWTGPATARLPRELNLARLQSMGQPLGLNSPASRCVEAPECSVAGQVREGPIAPIFSRSSPRSIARRWWNIPLGLPGATIRRLLSERVREQLRASWSRRRGETKEIRYLRSPRCALAFRDTQSAWQTSIRKSPESGAESPMTPACQPVRSDMRTTDRTHAAS